MVMPMGVGAGGRFQGLQPLCLGPPSQAESQSRTPRRQRHGGWKKEAGKCPSPSDPQPASLGLRPLDQLIDLLCSGRQPVPYFLVPKQDLSRPSPDDPGSDSPTVLHLCRKVLSAV